MKLEEKLVIDERFVFTTKAKNKVFTIIGLGLFLFALGMYMVMSGGGHHEDAHGAVQAAGHAAKGHHDAFNWMTRVWVNLWHNTVFFAGVSVMGVFIVAYNYVAYAGWSAGLIRVPMSFGSFLPYAFGIMLIVFFFGHHDLFHWTHDGLTDPNSPHYDRIIAGKSGFLNTPFYLIRMFIYFSLWIYINHLIRKNSFAEDINGTHTYWHKNTIVCTVFLIIFGVTSSMSAWDFVMSVDPHWFSTMFGWYVFASWHVSAIAAVTLIVVLLKERGYLTIVTENHLHDLGKFMFAFSIFWTYIWFSQFLLIFYAHIPEETVYFLDRMKNFGNHYTGLFYLNIFINFIFPFLVLMTRDAKRHMIILKIVSIAILFGHWLDFYLMLTPGTLKGHSGFGPLEIGTALVFLGVFIYVIANALSKAPLVAKNHPMLEESLHHNI
jgi:hypothetical protein